MMVTITQTDQLSDTTALGSSKGLRLFKSVDDKSRSMQAVADAGQKKKEIMVSGATGYILGAFAAFLPSIRIGGAPSSVVAS